MFTELHHCRACIYFYSLSVSINKIWINCCSTVVLVIVFRLSIAYSKTVIFFIATYLELYWVSSSVIHEVCWQHIYLSETAFKPLSLIFSGRCWCWWQLDYWPWNMHQWNSLFFVFVFCSSATVFVMVCSQPTTVDENDIGEVDRYHQLVNNDHFQQLATLQTKLAKLEAKNEKLELELESIANRKYLYHMSAYAVCKLM